jgi:HYR domain
MKILSILLVFFACAIECLGQSFEMWSEDFATGCDAGNYATGLFTPYGGWTVVDLDVNADDANNWFVSAAENGNGAGNCGSGCGDNRTLHIGMDQSVFGHDLGASYYEGLDGFCGLVPCGTTQKRIESPVFVTNEIVNMTLQFDYIEGGNAFDNASIWIKVNDAWQLLEDLDKTFSVNCAPQGLWTAHSIILPPSASNQVGLQFGFLWENNDDGDQTFPSFAIDNISLTGEWAEDITAPELDCPAFLTVGAFEGQCGVLVPYMDEYITIYDENGVYPYTEQSYEIDDPLNAQILITFTATDFVGNSSSCQVLLIPVDITPPSMLCTDSIELVLQGNLTEGYVDIPLPDVFDCTSFALSNSFNNQDDASDMYPSGLTTVVFYAIDPDGNSQSCATEVNVIINPIDCCPGDFNCDGVVSVLDMLILINNFGCVANCVADLDGNNFVTVADLTIFIELYGTICAD